MLLREDIVRLRHMLDAARDGVGFLAGRKRTDLDSDRMLSFAVVRAIEIVGEAAGKVSPQARAAAPNIPWADVTAMRNRLIHAYHEVDLSRVWDTVTDDLPTLICELERVLASEGDKSG